MSKVYIRKCDNCKKEIQNLYEYGVTTLYKQIRVGRGNSIHDYREDSILNHVIEKNPDDCDLYGSGWKNDENKEFSFCSPECLIKFMAKIYSDTYNSSLEYIKKEKKEGFDLSYEEFIKKHGETIPFFKKIQNSFSKDMFRRTAVKEADKLISELKEAKKKILEGKS